MKHDLTPSGALADLAVQHAALLDMMEHCEELADALDAGAAEPDLLLREVARLRVAFDAHNRFEEQLLRPMLVNAGWMGTATASMMVEQHVEEHRSMRQQMGSPTTSELRAVIGSLRAHLQAEERGLLSRNVLRDDLA